MDTVLGGLPPASRIAVVRLRSLGDCVLTTPALEILKRARPDAHIAVIVEDRFRAVFEGNPDLDEILPPNLAALRGWHPALCLNLHGGTRSAWLTALSGARWRVGFAHFRHAGLYNLRIPRAQEILGVDRKVHTAEHLASAIFHLGAPICEIPRAKLFPPNPQPQTPNPQPRTSNLSPLAPDPWPLAPGPRPPAPGPCVVTGPWPPAPGPWLPTPGPRPPASGPWLPTPGPVAAVHPFAATPEKTWPAANFLAVAEHLKSAGLDPVFIGAAEDDLTLFRSYTTVQGAPLSEIKQILASASLFIGNDSGPAHMAAAFGLPVVAIFSASDPEIWGPWRTPCEIVRAPASPARIIDSLARLKGVPA